MYPAAYEFALCVNVLARVYDSERNILLLMRGKNYMQRLACLGKGIGNLTEAVVFFFRPFAEEVVLLARPTPLSSFDRLDCSANDWMMGGALLLRK